MNPDLQVADDPCITVMLRQTLNTNLKRLIDDFGNKCLHRIMVYC